MDTNGDRRRNKRWPEALKLEIVAATREPGASVSVVARRYNVNANQVFSWRRRYTAAKAPLAARSSAGLVPVTITPEAESRSPSAPAASETIEIEVVGDYRIRVGSSFDVRALKRVLDVLRKR